MLASVLLRWFYVDAVVATHSYLELTHDRYYQYSVSMIDPLIELMTFLSV